jgi:hypothetical protein
MRSLRIPRAIACSLLLLVSTQISAQSAATTHLLGIINSEDDNLIEDELPKATVDAGPSAIPALRDLLQRLPEGDKRLITLAAIAFIGGDAAIPIVRAEYARTKDEDLKAEIKTGLAATLSTVDSAENRAQLIRMLSDDPEDWSTVEAAALSLGLLRVKEAIPALRRVPKDPNLASSQAADLALQWIDRGYWNIATAPSNDEGRAIAAVLRNGSPNIKESDYVLDERDGALWKHGSSGWSFTRGDLPGNSGGPKVSAHIGTEGSRALVTVDMHCGPLCGTGYAFFLRREGGNWKVQMIVMMWVE